MRSVLVTGGYYGSGGVPAATARASLGRDIGWETWWVKRPAIYGDETKLRRALARYIARGEELLDQARGVHKRVETLPPGLEGELQRFIVEQPWVDDVRRWRRNVINGLGPYLGEQAEVLFDEVLRVQLPPDTGKPRHHLGLNNLEPWLAGDVAGLKQLQAAIGVGRNVAAAAAPAPPQFAELRASGLVEPAVVDDWAREMLGPRTPKQLGDAIGAAKELVEATLRAALDQLQVEWKTKQDMPTLMGAWCRAVAAHTAPDGNGEETARHLLRALARFEAEWRNSYGRGHGRKNYPTGLRLRHARLAADNAEAAIRFIVTTMDDAQLLPP